tara:strand:- start:246 stop:533 length:288 start_codon:yes stop_codon:yes gene_type:complete
MRYSNEVVRISGKNWKQVNKTTAKKVYDSNKAIMINPCNMRINNPWTAPFEVKKGILEENCWHQDATFDSIVNEFEYYNCNNEMGNYSNFFASID